MEILVLVLAFLVMLVGMVGVLVPVMPGLLLVWIAGVASLLFQGLDAAAWWTGAWLTLLFVLGSVATIVLPARRGREAGAPTRSFAAAVLGAIAGFFVVPVLGFLLGALAGLLLAERVRLGEWAAARASTGAVLRAYGTGVLIEAALGVVMVGSWLVVVLLRLG